MIITKTQLEKWIKIPNNIYDLTNEHIAEVDSFIPNYVTATNLVTGKVVFKGKHPNADTLSLTKVDIGNGVIKDIVCGASNVAEGQYVVVALVGAVLPGNFEIKDAVIRGQKSEGMICSLAELHVKDIPEEYANGIFHFPHPVKLGVNALEILKFYGFVMELDLTPNAGHLLSTLGYAYDLAAVTRQKITLPKFDIKEVDTPNPIKVRIDDDGCTLYHARVADVTIKPSPWWLQSELIKRGIEPINNVVDISNFVLFEYGTPLHMFDYYQFGSNEIVIRSARDNEVVESLGDKTYTLSQGDIVITNGTTPMAIGGVVGLKNSMVLPTTTKVIIEAAHFMPERIQKTAGKIGRSDSSLRYERGVDQSIVKLALETATHLLVKYADAKIYQGIATDQKKVLKPHTISFETKYINKLLGTRFTTNKIVNMLRDLHFKVEFSQNKVSVTIPLRRPDLKIPADIAEEIGRLYGFNRIPNKPLVDSLEGGKSKDANKELMLQKHLASLGLNEVITYSLIDLKSIHDFNNIGDPYQILMPLTEERMVMRQSLLNGLVRTYQYNVSRQNKSVNIFEIGSVYTKDIEKKYLSILINSKLNYNLWQKDNQKVDFYDAKGLLENLLSKLKVEITLTESHNQSLHPYRQGYVLHNENIIGILGEVHPKIIKDDKVYVIELDLEYLLSLDFTNDYETISRFPNVERDIAFIVSKGVNLLEIEAIIKQTARKYLVSLELFDIYTGENIPKGHQSLAYRLVFNSKESTLESQDVDKVMRSVMNRLSHVFKAEIR
ncbi:MAG: phenylalanine--tRNA ligase subunit beta [Acholeplasmataceae bacterium]|jgi:phenylalanyl-tRNA synthetase beta chain